MEKLPRKNFIFISLMLFSMFFGAGNLIFPPFLGENAASNFLSAMTGFLVSAVGFPVLGMYVVSRIGGLDKLGNLVHPKFSLVFGIIIYLSIGPCLAIPRAASMPYEMAIAAYLPEGFSIQLGLVIFSVLFFGFCFAVSSNPSKAFDTLGKIMTPLLLVLIFAVFVMAFIKPLTGEGLPTGGYEVSPFIKGFLEGYLTMDTIAALNFGILVVMSIRAVGMKEESAIARTSIQIGVLAGIILAVVYTMLGWLGAEAAGQFAIGANGAVTMTNIVLYFFGDPGAVILAAIFLLSCLTTCVGLITSCSEYFSSLTPKLSYKVWVGILTLWSLLITNMGLTNILSISVPILNCIYPAAIVLIVLGLFHRALASNRLIFPLTVTLTILVSVICELDFYNLSIPGITPLLSHLPLYELRMGWITIAAIGIVVSLVFGHTKAKQTVS